MQMVEFSTMALKKVLTMNEKNYIIRENIKEKFSFVNLEKFKPRSSNNQ